MKLRKRGTALALAAMMLAALVLTAGAADAGSRNVFLPEGIELTAPDQAAEGYVRYENDHVRFAMELPEEYTVTEPYENTVLITEEDPTDFQVHAEYAFTTPDNAHFLYDAQDFASLIEADKQQLTDWLGVDGAEVLGTGWGNMEGKPCYVCAFTMNGGDISGALYVFDGQGDFGCYCVTAVLNEKSDKAALYGEQLQHMVETFTVTGPYQMEGYTLHEQEDEGVPVAFFVKDGINVDDDEPDIYPVDGVYSEANIHIYRTGWEADRDGAQVLESSVSLYIDDRGGRYLAQPSHFDLGRYSYDMVDVAYEQYDEQFTTRSAVFPSGGYWWKAYANYTAEYADAVNDAFSDVLFSLRVDGDAAVPGTSSAPTPSAATAAPAAQSVGTVVIPNVVEQIVNSIEAQAGFGVSASYYEPLGCVWYLPEDGRLLLAMYEISDSSNGFDDWYVCTDAWLVKDGGALLLGRNQLYQEVGGNSGSVSVVQKDGVVYMEMECHLWEGDQFNNYYVYLPVDEQARAFGQGVYMEAHGTVGQEDSGEYIIDGEYWPRGDFDLARSEYEELLTMDINQGPVQFGAKRLDELPASFPDEDIFAVRSGL